MIARLLLEYFSMALLGASTFIWMRQRVEREQERDAEGLAQVEVLDED